MAANEFSIGGLHGWDAVLLGLTASALFLLGGWQDLRSRSNIGSASCAFWFLLALASAGCVIWLGVGDRIWGAALLGVALFGFEAWLIQRSWRRRHSA